MKRGVVRTLAIFLALLVLSIPLVTAQNANSGTQGGAASVEIDEVTGRDGKPGYTRGNDLLQASATVFLLSDPQITNEQAVLVIGSARVPARECLLLSGNIYRCEFSYQLTGSSGQHETRVELIDDAGTLRAQDTTSFIADDKQPELLDFTLSTRFTKENSVTLRYQASDTASASTDSAHCAGLQALIITENNGAEILRHPLGGGCVAQGQVSVPLKQERATHSLCARPIDLFGNEGSQFCQTISQDTTPPRLEEINILQDGARVEYVQSFESFLASVDVRVEDEAVDRDSVTLSIAGQEPQLPISQDGSTFRWQGISLTSLDSCDIHITATDQAGNTAEKTYPCPIKLDNTGPSELRLTSNYRAGGDLPLIAREGTVLSLSMLERGSGVDNTTINLDLSELGMGRQEPPNKCMSNGEQTTCYWPLSPDIDARGIYEVHVTERSRDRIGNFVQGERTFQVEADFSTPDILDVKTAPQQASWQEDITIQFEVRNVAGEPKVRIYTGNFTPGVPSLEGTCIEIGERRHKCKAVLRGLSQKHTEGTIRLEVTEQTGKYTELDIPLKVYDYDAESEPDLYSLRSVRLAPKQIDTQIASLNGFKLFVKTAFEASGGGARIGQKTLACGNQTLQHLAEAPQLLSEDSDQPIILLTFGESVSNASVVVIDCTLSMSVVSGTTIMGKPEVEKIYTIVPLNNNELGTIRASLNEKIRAIDEEIDDVEDQIDDYQQIINTFGLYCQIAKIIGEVDVAITAVKTIIMTVLMFVAFILFVVGERLREGGLTAGAGVAMVEAARGVHNANFGGLGEALGWVLELLQDLTWPAATIFPDNGFQIIGLISKYSCMIFFDCLLADIDGWFGLAVSAINDARSGPEWGKEDEVVKEEGVFDLEATPPDDEVLAAHHVEADELDDIKIDTIPSAEGYRYRVPGEGDETTRVEWFRSGRGFKLQATDSGETNKITQQDIFMRQNARFTATDQLVTQAVGEGGQLGTEGYGLTWNTEGKYTAAPFSTKNWAWNPYISIHYAQAVACLPAMAYNLKKDRQIKCLYRGCLRAQEGISAPADVCERAYSQRQCLYIESAQYKLHGFLPPDLLLKILIGLTKAVVVFIIGEIISKTCGDFSLNEASEALASGQTGSAGYAADVFRLMVKIAWCGSMETTNMVLQIIESDAARFSENTYNIEPEIDHCGP